VPTEKIPQVSTQSVQQVAVPDVGVNVVADVPPVQVFNPAPPIVTTLPLPVVNLPSGLIPSYEPIEIYSRSRPAVPKIGDPGKKSEEEVSDKDRVVDLKSIIRAAEAARADTSLNVETRELLPTPPTDLTVKNEIQVPFIGTVPVPTNKEITLAGTTAFAATGAALVGKSAVEYLLKVLKPVAQRTWLWVKKAVFNQDFNEYEIQMWFAFEREAGMKKVVKQFRKEERKERLRQHLEHLEQRHLRIPWRKEKQDERTHQPSLLHHTSTDAPVQSQDGPCPPQPSDG